MTAIPPSSLPVSATKEFFPDQNPNPVLRVEGDGRLSYANAAAEPITAAWGVQVGEQLPRAVGDAIRTAAAASPHERVEVENERQTFAVLPVYVPDLDAYNLYGTDVTAWKVVERFPGRNPNPVLRMTPDGHLWYANEASRPITLSLGVGVGDPLPAGLVTALQAHMADPSAPSPEVAGEGGLTFRLTPVVIPEFDFVNLYGTDITAEKAIDKFPNQNPNPVLRLNHAGVLTYSNPASSLVRQALGATVGEHLDSAALGRIQAALDRPDDPTFELDADGRVYRIRAVAVAEFESINLYGTDITAARQVEALSAANEKLLLNILPASIAERLRSGERVIADRFDDMTVLFADVVGFTELSSRLQPDEVVTLLNDVFTLCDGLAERFGLEKIKTVGDAYMVVGGLGSLEGTSDGHASHVRETHSSDVADMALAMLDGLAAYGREHGRDLRMRVGLNVGPAVAGVIGLKKFIYDVWGDTVNTASRMESTGLPGRIQVTSQTYERLRDEFAFEPRGLVSVKGKGEIETWFLTGRRQDDKGA